MGLVNDNLVRRLASAGFVSPDASWSERDVLDEWLARQGVALAEVAALLEDHFGLPYRPLDAQTRLLALPLPAGAGDWMAYQLPFADVCVCLRPPDAKERRLYEALCPATPLALTDAVRVQTAQLQALLPPQAATQPAALHSVSLEALCEQAQGHVDGVIGRIFADAIACEATDVHLYPMGGALRVVFRVAGQLRTYAALPLQAADGLINKLKLLAEMDIAEHRLPQDGHILLRADGADHNLRLGTLPLYDGEKMVIRILPAALRRETLPALGFSPAQVETMQRLLARRQGLLLLTGPTNSGKTTTLYACLRALVQTDSLVYTIEDPIEAVLPEVQQMQVNVRSGFTFAVGLRGILRADPDVIAVGELRDEETLDIAARAALSGQLVIATLHAHDAHQAVSRLRDLGLSDRLLSTVLLAVVNQRLLAQPCARCQGRGHDDAGHVCAHCLGSGVAGRTGVQEIWQPAHEERAAIEAGVSSFVLRQRALDSGFRTLWAAAQEKRLRLPDEEGWMA